MTQRCSHLDLLQSLDSDAFLMAFWCVVARTGKPYKVLADCGTNEEDMPSWYSTIWPLPCRNNSFNPPQLPAAVLKTFLVEGILNSKIIGCVSSDVADVDPATTLGVMVGCIVLSGCVCKQPIDEKGMLVPHSNPG